MLRRVSKVMTFALWVGKSWTCFLLKIPPLLPLQIFKCQKMFLIFFVYPRQTKAKVEKDNIIIITVLIKRH